MAAVLTAMLLSLAGLPLTAGFVGKFIILTVGCRRAAVDPRRIPRNQWDISIFYYLSRSAMFRGPGRERGAGRSPRGRAPFLAALAIALLMVGVVALWRVSHAAGLIHRDIHDRRRDVSRCPASRAPRGHHKRIRTSSIVKASNALAWRKREIGSREPSRMHPTSVPFCMTYFSERCASHPPSRSPGSGALPLFRR